MIDIPFKNRSTTRDVHAFITIRYNKSSKFSERKISTQNSLFNTTYSMYIMDEQAKKKNEKSFKTAWAFAIAVQRKTSLFIYKIYPISTGDTVALHCCCCADAGGLLLLPNWSPRRASAWMVALTVIGGIPGNEIGVVTALVWKRASVCDWFWAWAC